MANHQDNSIIERETRLKERREQDAERHKKSLIKQIAEVLKTESGRQGIAKEALHARRNNDKAEANRRAAHLDHASSPVVYDNMGRGVYVDEEDTVTGLEDPIWNRD